MINKTVFFLQVLSNSAAKRIWEHGHSSSSNLPALDEPPKTFFRQSSQQAYPPRNTFQSMKDAWDRAVAGGGEKLTKTKI